METVKFGFKYFKKSMPLAVFAELISFLGILAELLLPMLSGMFIDFVIKNRVEENQVKGIFSFLLNGKYGEVHSMKLFLSISVIYISMLILRVGLIYVRDLIQEWIGLRLETDLRYSTYRKLMELDSQTVADYNSGELLQVLNSDTIMFKELFSHRIPYLFDSIFMLVTTVALIAKINISFMIIPVIMTPVLIKVVLNFKKQARKNFKEIRKRSSELNLTVQENIAAVRIVRSFTNEKFEEEKFEKSNREFSDSRLNQIYLHSKFDLMFNSIKQIAYIGTIIIGAVLVMTNYITIGYILASSTYVMRIMNNITGLNNHIFNMQQMMIAGVELKSFMERESNVPDNKDSKLYSDTPDIELKDVKLVIDNQEILNGVNLSIPYGKKVGIVGETGSGKSALLKTLVRICDISGGSITIDGHDIKDFSLKNLRDMYSYVFQDVFLFSNTIESNIAYNKSEIDEKSVKNAAVHAQADKFINELSERYKTIVGERGIGISGGQKQRISIARAFHKDSPVIVLDDSTSALDVKTEKRLLEDIHNNFSEKTVIITAHRFSSVVDCDEILYMKEGYVVERGTFDELMERDGSFARIYNEQQARDRNAIYYKNSEGGESLG